MGGRAWNITFPSVVHFSDFFSRTELKLLPILLSICYIYLIILRPVAAAPIAETLQILHNLPLHCG